MSTRSLEAQSRLTSSSVSTSDVSIKLKPGPSADPVGGVVDEPFGEGHPQREGGDDDGEVGRRRGDAAELHPVREEGEVGQVDRRRVQHAWQTGQLSIKIESYQRAATLAGPVALERLTPFSAPEPLSRTRLREPCGDNRIDILSFH